MQDLVVKAKPVPTCDMYHGMERSFTLTRGLRVSVFLLNCNKISPQFFPPVSPFWSLVSSQGSDRALVLILQQTYVKIQL